MVRPTLSRFTVLIAAAAFLCSPSVQAQDKLTPTDQEGRPLRDSEGKLLNYETSPAFSPTVAKAFATAASSTLALPAVTPESPEWQYSVFGTSIGSSGILIEQNNGVREIYVGGSARGGFWGNDFWQVLRWDGVAKNYQQAWVSAPLTAGLIRLAVGNVTGDADREIVATLQDGTVIFYNLADKSITGRITLVSGLRQMRLHDLDSDGRAEIVVTTESELRVYSGTGTLLWSVPTAGGGDLVIANMDADSGVEIATTSGKVVDATTHAVQWTYANGFGSILRAADVDGDGRAELISSAGWYQIYCYDVDTMLPKWSIATDLDIGAIELANVDADPLPELLIGDGQWGEIHAFELSTRVQQWQIPNPEHGVTQIAVGDVDSDGKLEVLWGAGASSTGEDHLYVADIATLTREWENVHLDGPFLSPVVADLDGDGTMELVTATTESDAGYSSGRILVFDAETRALRGISNPVCDNYSWTGIRSLKVRDIDGDGGKDIIIATDWLYDGTIEIYGFSKQNAFTRKWTNAVRPSGSPFTVADVIDIDGDGALEVVAANGIAHTGSAGGYIRFYDLATRQQEWQSVQIGAGWSGITGMEIGDFDHDGRLEVLALVPGQNITSFDGTEKATDAQITGTFSALASKADGSIFYTGDSTGKINSFTYSNGAYVPGTPWTASTEKIDGLTLDGASLWVSSGGQIKRWAAPGALDWASIDFGDFVSPRIAVFDASAGKKAYLGTRGTLAGFPEKAAESKPVVSLTGSGTLREGTADSVALTVQINKAITSPLTVRFSVSGSAGAADFALQGAQPDAVAGQWKIDLAAGESSRTFTVSAADDQALEDPEQLNFTVVGSNDYTVGDSGFVSLPITDDEAAKRPTVSISGSGNLQEGQSAIATMALSLDKISSEPLTVEFSSSGSADLSDFTMIGAQHDPVRNRWAVNFAAGEKTRTFMVTAVDDGKVEATETVVLALQSAASYIVGQVSTATISIADAAAAPKPVVDISGSGSIREDSGSLALSISLNGPAKAPLTVRFSLSGSASAADFTLSGNEAGSVTFAAGETTRIVTISALNDLLPEGTEDVVLTLLSSTDYLISAASAAVAIEDDEFVLSVSATDSEASEQKAVRHIDNAVFTLRRTGNLKKPLVVRYSLSGTAANGADYRTLPGIVTFNPGKDEAQVRIIPKGDRLAEPTENVVLTLLPSSRYAVNPASSNSEVTIMDNEPVVNAAGAKLAASQWGTYASFTFTRSDSNLNAPLSASFLVTRAFSDGTEESEVGTVRFPAGAERTTLAMPPYELGSRGAEQITVELINAPAYHLGDVLESSITLPAPSKL
jgi:hypothetical protein